MAINQMIKGMDILLHEKDGAEVISNVLVGEPTSAEMTDLADNDSMITYLLAIPKGDTHDWIDSKVEFFGETFRTLGYPLQGIEANMPLSWHKKVRVERLKTNADCTIYEKDTFKKHIFKNVHYCDNRGETYSKDGVKIKGDVNIHIYAVNTSDFSYFPQLGDIVVPTECSFEFDTTSEKSISESMKEFRKLYPDYSTVSASSRKVYGSLPDYIIASR